MDGIREHRPGESLETFQEELAKNPEVPWELQEGAEAKELDTDEAMEVVEEQKSFLKSTMDMLRGSLGLEGMKGFRRAKKLLAAMRLILVLGTGAEAVKNILSHQDTEPLPEPDETVQMMPHEASPKPVFVNLDEIGGEKKYVFLTPEAAGLEGDGEHGHAHAEGEPHSGTDEVEAGVEVPEQRTPEQKQQDNESFVKNLLSGGSIIFFAREHGKEMKNEAPFASYAFGDNLLAVVEQGKTIKADGTLEVINAHIDPTKLSAEDQEKYNKFVEDGEEFVDPKGNVVKIGEQGQLVIMLRQQFEVLEEKIKNGENADVQTIPVDLRDIGLGQTEELLASEAPNHFGTAGEDAYHVWGSMDLDIEKNPQDQERYDEIMETAQQLAKGVGSAEKFFGAKPGEMIERIVVVPVEKEGLFVARQDPNTVYMTTARTFEGARQADTEMAGRHEALHGLSTQFNSLHEQTQWTNFYTDSVAYYDEMIDDFDIDVEKLDKAELEERNAVLEELTKKLQEKYGDQADREMAKLLRTTQADANINERNFFGPLSEIGGHAFENQSELFASFVNSLMDDHWEEKMMDVGSSEKFLEWNLKGLQNLDSILADAIDISETAPIRDAIPAKILFLESMLEHMRAPRIAGTLAQGG